MKYLLRFDYRGAKLFEFKIQRSKFRDILTQLHPDCNCFHPKTGACKNRSLETLFLYKIGEKIPTHREDRKEKTKEDGKQISNVNTNCRV